MKKKFLYIASLSFCLCMFNATSKECGKNMNVKCSQALSEGKSNPETKSAEQDDSKSEFSLIQMLLLKTI